MTSELAWTLASAAGTVLGIFGAMEAWRDLRALDGLANGRHVWARGDLRNQIGRAVIQGTWLVAGVLLMFDGREIPWTPLVVMLVGTNAAIAALSAFDLRDRMRVIRLYRRTDV